MGGGRNGCLRETFLSRVCDGHRGVRLSRRLALKAQHNRLEGFENTDLSPGVLLLFPTMLLREQVATRTECRNEHVAEGGVAC